MLTEKDSVWASAQGDQHIVLLGIGKGPALPLNPTDPGLLGIGDGVMLLLKPIEPGFDVGEKRALGRENGQDSQLLWSPENEKALAESAGGFHVPANAKKN